MKKTLVILLVMIFTFSLAACGGEDSIPENQTNNSTLVQSNTNDENQEDKKLSNEITLSYSYKVAGKNIYIDVPNYQEIDKGFTQLYILHGLKYVAVTADVNSTATDLNTAHEYAFNKFKANIQNYSYVNSLTVTEDKTETINDIEVYKYEGVLNCALDYSNRDNSYDAYVIGYSFIMDGVPCTVTGSVIDQAQEQEMIDEMKATVEAMIKTLRSER